MCPYDSNGCAMLTYKIFNTKVLLSRAYSLSAFPEFFNYLLHCVVFFSCILKLNSVPLKWLSIDLVLVIVEAG